MKKILTFFFLITIHLTSFCFNHNNQPLKYTKEIPQKEVGIAIKKFNEILLDESLLLQAKKNHIKLEKNSFFYCKKKLNINNYIKNTLNINGHSLNQSSSKTGLILKNNIVFLHKYLLRKKDTSFPESFFLKIWELRFDDSSSSLWFVHKGIEEKTTNKTHTTNFSIPITPVTLEDLTFLKEFMSQESAQKIFGDDKPPSYQAPELLKVLTSEHSQQSDG
ncbi:MAG: hypothetical protein H6731_08270 [Myxococcales bacterium]|nr:MAG: hypothetical protein H6731_08270 [Myxococcales bacterium]